MGEKLLKDVKKHGEKQPGLFPIAHMIRVKTYSVSVYLYPIIGWLTVEKRTLIAARREFTTILKDASDLDLAVVAWSVRGPRGERIAGVDELGIAKHDRWMRKENDADIRARYVDSLR